MGHGVRLGEVRAAKSLKQEADAASSWCLGIQVKNEISLRNTWLLWIDCDVKTNFSDVP